MIPCDYTEPMSTLLVKYCGANAVLVVEAKTKLSEYIWIHAASSASSAQPRLHANVRHNSNLRDVQENKHTRMSETETHCVASKRVGFMVQRLLGASSH